jgi:SAM-dependent methyltransferase
MVFLSPRMSPDSMKKFYQKGYRVHDIENDKPMQWVIEKEQERARYQVDLINAWARTPLRLLDIGASTGQLLQMAAQRFGCEAVGVEPGDIYRADAGQAFRLYPNVNVLISAGEMRFDIITVSHVLEHLPEPVAFLSNVRDNLLKEDGVLYVEVPNLYGHSCFEPSHLYSFTNRTLGMLLRSAGFFVTHLKTHSMPRDFGWRNISVLARPSTPEGVTSGSVFPAWVKFQRAVGLSGTRHWYGYLYLQMRKKMLHQ